MKSLLLVGLAAFCVGSSCAIGWEVNWGDTWGNGWGNANIAPPSRPALPRRPVLPQQRKVVCYWNSTSFQRTGFAKFGVNDLKPALSSCTHLIYGYAGISVDNHEVIPLHPILDAEKGEGFYRQVVLLKRSYPHLKVYLSVGGDADPYEKTHKYLTVTETPWSRKQIVTSLVRLLNTYNFDGVDLAWQFPPVAEKKKRSIFGTVIHTIAKQFGYGDFKDKRKDAHRNGFTQLVRDLKAHLWNKDLTITILPHVSAKIYYNVKLLVPHINAVHLMQFDWKTPERNPQEADYTAPIYGHGADGYSIDDAVRYWLQNETPGSKIIVGIPTFARTWRIVGKKQIIGDPPITAEGPGFMGMYTKTPGFLSYPEVCNLVARQVVHRVGDVSRNLGSYAYSVYNSSSRYPGNWIGFEEPYTAGDKASYVKSKGLGGVAIFDLSNDDFYGSCNGEKFPILHGAVNNL